MKQKVFCRNCVWVAMMFHNTAPFVCHRGSTPSIRNPYTGQTTPGSGCKTSFSFAPNHTGRCRFYQPNFSTRLWASIKSWF